VRLPSGIAAGNSWGYMLSPAAMADRLGTADDSGGLRRLLLVRRWDPDAQSQLVIGQLYTDNERGHV